MSQALLECCQRAAPLTSNLFLEPSRANSRAGNSKKRRADPVFVVGDNTRGVSSFVERMAWNRGWLEDIAHEDD